MEHTVAVPDEDGFIFQLQLCVPDSASAFYFGTFLPKKLEPRPFSTFLGSNQNSRRVSPVFHMGPRWDPRSFIASSQAADRAMRGPSPDLHALPSRPRCMAVLLTAIAMQFSAFVVCARICHPRVNSGTRQKTIDIGENADLLLWIICNRTVVRGLSWEAPQSHISEGNSLSYKVYRAKQPSSKCVFFALRLRKSVTWFTPGRYLKMIRNMYKWEKKFHGFNSRHWHPLHIKVQPQASSQGL